MDFRTPREGEFVDDVTLELVAGVDAGITRPRLRPVTDFSPDLRVEFPRIARERFPLGTRFRVKVKVCQKHDKRNAPNGPPYLRACEGTIQVVASSLPDAGWFAVHNAEFLDFRAYKYTLAV